MRDVRAINLTAVSGRELCYVSENEGFRFWEIWVYFGPHDDDATRRRDKSEITRPHSHHTQGPNTS